MEKTFHFYTDSQIIDLDEGVDYDINFADGGMDQCGILIRVNNPGNITLNGANLIDGETDITPNKLNKIYVFRDASSKLGVYSTSYYVRTISL